MAPGMREIPDERERKRNTQRDRLVEGKEGQRTDEVAQDG